VKNFIPVCEPYLNGNELKYVQEAITSNWISSKGQFIDKFEKEFANFCGVQYASGVCNGTVALHLALVALDIGPGDEVIIPNFTMMSTALCVYYTGAVPVFVEADSKTWNIDIEKIEERITKKTKAILAVHIFGNPCDMDSIHKIAQKHGLRVVEDAAEAHGAEYKGIKTGALADIAAFSFYANKNLTTGEGGMVVTQDEELYDKCRYYKNVCFPLDGKREFLHEHIGFNYRMSNLHAAIGLAQVEKAYEYRENRIKNSVCYKQRLTQIEGITFPEDEADSLNVHWMNAVLIDPETFGISRDEIIEGLKLKGIETRLLFTGMHEQPSLKKIGCDCSGEYPVTENLTKNGFYLPSASNLSENQIDYICSTLISLKK
jgi:perosamine synthetase